MGGAVGRYRKVGLLGQGGMGKVFLAFDPVLERYVAVKQIGRAVLHHPENATLLAYFEREAKVVASLQHPNIIQIYEYGHPPGAPAWIVTEFVDGITFEELMEELNGVDPAGVLSLVHPVAEALEYAHEREIIHRDLKPGNIMLSRQGRAYLMDFGLAKSLSGDGLKSMVIGSPAFMAPEQVEGKDTDCRTDVFSFGLLVYSLATGALFFSAEAPKAFVEILTEEYPRPDQLEAVGDPTLVELIRRCVHRDPAQRLQTMTDVLALVEAGLVQHGIASAGRALRRRMTEWVELMPQQYTGGAGSERDTSLGQATPPAPAPSFHFGDDMDVSDQRSIPIADSPAEAQQQAAPTEIQPVEADPGDTQPIDGAPDLSWGDSQPVDEEAPIWDPGPLPEVWSPAGGEAAREMTIELPPEHAIERVRAEADRCPDPDAARALILLAASRGGRLTFLEIQQALGTLGLDVQTLSAQLAALVQEGTVVQRGEQAVELGDPELAAGAWALAHDSSAARRALESVLRSLLATVDDALHRFERDQAEALLHRAAAACGQVPVASDIVTEVLLRRAELDLELGEVAGARDQFEEALAAAPGGEPAFRAREGLASCFLHQGRPGRALELIDAGLQAAAQEGASRWTGRFQRLRGLVRLQRGELRAAVVDLRAALAESAAEPHEAALTRLLLGEALWWTGAAGEAERAFVEATEALEDQGDVRWAARGLALQGWARLGAGALDEARDLLESARGSAKPTGARPVLSDTQVWLGEIERLDGQPREARRLIRRGLAQAEALRDPRRIPLARAALANVLCDLDELEQASRLAEEACRSLADDPLGAAQAGLVLAKIACRHRDHDRAVALLSRVLGDVEARGGSLPLARHALARLQAGGSAPPGPAGDARERLERGELDRWLR